MIDPLSNCRGCEPKGVQTTFVYSGRPPFLHKTIEVIIHLMRRLMCGWEVESYPRKVPLGVDGQLN